MTFLKETSMLKELRLLQHIESYPNTTQKQIAKAIDSAPSMVNAYIDNLEKKQYLKRVYRSAKNVSYHITTEGVKRKNFLMITYFQELIDVYFLVGQSMEFFFRDLENRGIEKVLLYGAGKVAETILMVISGRTNKPLKVLAIIDDDPDLLGRDIQGYKIISKNQIPNYPHDSIIITSYTYEDTIMKKLTDIKYPNEKIEKLFTI